MFYEYMGFYKKMFYKNVLFLYNLLTNQIHILELGSCR